MSKIYASNQIFSLFVFLFFMQALIMIIVQLLLLEALVNVKSKKRW